MCHHNPNDVLNKLNGNIPLEPGLMVSHDMCFGTRLKLVQLHIDIRAWSMSLSKYDQEALRICKEYITKCSR